MFASCIVVTAMIAPHRVEPWCSCQKSLCRLPRSFVPYRHQAFVGMVAGHHIHECTFVIMAEFDTVLLSGTVEK
jgi:hypothetical protein